MSVRRAIKIAIFAVCVLPVAPLIVLSWIEKHIFRGETLFSCGAQMVALLPGLPGSYLRGAYYFATLHRCAWETHVGFGSIFTHRGSSLETHASMGSYCVIGHARIGQGVMMGSRVSVPSGKRQHLDATGQLTTATAYDTVTIGDRCWIGEGAIILADIGSDCIVAAGAVVVKEMPTRTLIGGNPARAIKELA